MATLERSSTGQIIPKEKREYNDRLFKKGWRKYLHESRYRWLQKKITQLQLSSPSILELGCFDAKTIDYLPSGFSRYAGYDANWEKGLELGRKRWRSDTAVYLVESYSIAGFNPAGENFDCTIAMETLEHLKIDELELYISRLAAATRHYLFVTIPYEKGLPLLLKHLYKSIRSKVDETYTLRELYYGVTGDLSKVKRIEGGHKGFDYRELISLLSKYFIIKEVQGLPFATLPLAMNFSIGIVACPRKS